MGTSENTINGLQGPSKGLIYGDGMGLGSAYAVEAQLTQRDTDGGVVGSYSPEVMDRLMRYHNDAPFVGDAVMGQQAQYSIMGGERIDA